MKTVSAIRPSPIAGTWYSGDPRRLAEEVDGYLQKAELPELPGKVIALIAPHAGHRYSGWVAAHAFRAVFGQSFDLVAVVSPMHYGYPPPLLTTAHSAYQTPLGEIQVDQAALAEVDAALKTELGFGLTPVSNDEEHSLEIELPFLQRALQGEFRLLPVMLRDQSPHVARALGRAIADSLRSRNALLVASSDLSHYYPEAVAAKLDQEMLHQIENFSPEGLYSAEETGQGQACGLGAIAAVLWAARDLGGDQARVLRYATSGAVTGDYSAVVGYGAAVVLKTT